MAKAANTASHILGLVMATFTCLDETTVPRRFTTMVRPHLDYGNLIWNSRFQWEKVEAEKIQRRATKLIPNMKQLPYENQLKVLGLPSLEYRRRCDMLQVFKIMNGIDRVESSIFFDMNTDSSTKGHDQKITKKHARLGIGQAVFSQRVVNDWNMLPIEVIHNPSSNSFKSRLDKFWLTEHYKLPWPSVFKTMYLQPRPELINRHSLYIPYIRYQCIKHEAYRVTCIHCWQVTN